MSGIAGILNIQDADRAFINIIGQKAVYDAAQQLLAQFNDGLNKAKSTFVEGQTSDYKVRYKLPGGGRLERRGGQAQSGGGKAYGSWDVAFPLEDFGRQLAGSDVDLAYMTVAEFQRHLDSVFIQDTNTVRFEMLKALFNNTARTFVDPNYGSLTIQPLANADAVVYPPVEGSESEATDDHYLESGYLASAISDTNNPLVTIRDEIEEHFGGGAQGGSNVAVFINNAQNTKVSALTDFSKIGPRFTTPGANSEIADKGVPTVPGKVIGYSNGVWVVEWRWVPANYMLGLHLEAPKPLMERVDPADTGLGTGFQLIAKEMATPFEASHYRHRFGFGVGNRLNGVVLELGDGGSYTIPTAYE
jgi:hypothetical protein